MSILFHGFLQLSYLQITTSALAQSMYVHVCMYVCINMHTNWNLVCRQTDDLLAPLVAGLTMEFLMLREESMSRVEALRVVDDPATPLP